MNYKNYKFKSVDDMWDFVEEVGLFNYSADNTFTTIKSKSFTPEQLEIAINKYSAEVTNNK